jgi:tRNA-dihydrouridine synthase A
MSSSIISIAPMMGYTNRYFRALLRMICPKALLYTEMISSAALVRREPSYVEHLLNFSTMEHPVVLQLGGSNPLELAQAARMGEQWGYDEINLNVGCPSSRVAAGNFGACLMKSPGLVSDCVSAMKEAVAIPISVKTRTGVDDRDSYEELQEFVEQVSNAGCEHFIIHARKAWLSGLNPRQNRELPPLRYDLVYRLKKEFNKLHLVINGGITESDSVFEHLKYMDGVMIGRAAYQNPVWLRELADIYGMGGMPFAEIVQAYLPIMEEGLRDGVPMAKLAGGIVGLLKGIPGARLFRQKIFDPEKSGSQIMELMLEVSHVWVRVSQALEY